MTSASNPGPSDGSAENKSEKRARMEWRFFAFLTLISLAIAVAGFLADLPLLLVAGACAALFCIFGVGYGLAKERS